MPVSDWPLLKSNQLRPKEKSARHETGPSAGRQSSVSVGSTRPNNRLFQFLVVVSLHPGISPRSPLRPRLLAPPNVSSLSLSHRLKSGCSSEASAIVVMERSLDSYSSIKDVTYSCGYCGYALHLNSSARDTAGIGSTKYGKQIKRGVVSFLAVDETRFTLADEVTCAPHFRAGRSWGLFRRRSRLLCRKCGGRIGTAREEEAGRDSSQCHGDTDVYSDDLRVSSGSSGGSSSSASSRMNYLIKIGALQLSSDDDAVVPFTL